MSEKCDDDVFRNGKGICTLDACRHRAEAWVQHVARASGQRVDWHYSGGIANVLYIGDYGAVASAVELLGPSLAAPEIRVDGQCGSCGGDRHRPGSVLHVFGAGAHGLYRAGDEVPYGTVAVDSLDTIIANERDGSASAFRLDYDENQVDVVDKIAAALKPFGLRIEFVENDDTRANYKIVPEAKPTGT